MRRAVYTSVMPSVLDVVITDGERLKIEEALAKLREAEEDLKAGRLKDWEEAAKRSSDLH